MDSCGHAWSRVVLFDVAWGVWDCVVRSTLCRKSSRKETFAKVGRAHLEWKTKETGNFEESNRFVRRNDVSEAWSCLRLRRVFTKDAHQGCQRASQKAHLGRMPMELRNSEYSNRFVRRNDDTVASSCLRLRRVFTKDAHQGCQRASQKAHLGLTPMELRNSE